MADKTPDEQPVKADVTRLSQDATAARMADIADEIRRVAAKDKITPEDDTYLDDLREEFDALDEHRKTIERQALVSRVDVATKRPLQTQRAHSPRDLDDDPFGEPGSIRDGSVIGNPYDESEMRTWGRSNAEVGSEYRARALSAIEKMAGTNDHRRQAMAGILEQNDTDDGRLSKLALRTSHPDYVRAFGKLARGASHAMLTVAEQGAVQRAMSLTDAAGGYLVPFQLDPTVIITSDGSFNEIRRAARQVVATGDTWNGVSSGSVSWSWDAEATEVSDDATTFAQPSIPVHKAAGFVPISLEALQDEQNVAAEVGRLLAFGKDELESVAFATGDGSAKPTGIITALLASAGAASVKATAGVGAFVIGDVYALQDDVPARYRSRGSFLGANGVYNLVRQFDTSGGAGLWEYIGNDRPNQLMGRNAYEVEAMDSAVATGNELLVFGDLSNYVIADRIGTTVEFIPHLFATANNLPSGQRGWYAYYRVGADSVNDGGMRVLQVA